MYDMIDQKLEINHRTLHFVLVWYIETKKKKKHDEEKEEQKNKSKSVNVLPIE